jgi:hypothetical protein
MSVALDTRRFGTNPTIDGGYEVVCEHTGRPVAHRASHQSANGVAFTLNEAMKRGPKALARALQNAPKTS